MGLLLIILYEGATGAPSWAQQKELKGRFQVRQTQARISDSSSALQTNVCDA